MKYQITHITKYTYSESASLFQNKLHLAPRQIPGQQVNDYRLLVSPEPSTNSYVFDYFGNRVDYFSISEPYNSLSVTSVSEVLLGSSPHAGIVRDRSKIVSPAWETLCYGSQNLRSLDTQQFTYPSKFVPQLAELEAYARLSFSQQRPILEACLDLTQRIHAEFQYDPKATTVSTPVAQVFELRRGVCQDFSHLQIACLRSLGLPARYVSGYLRTIPPEGEPHRPGSDESHAWLSVYCGAELGWVPFDPTNNAIPQNDHVVVGWGRDYSDLCPIQGVYTGGGQSTMKVSVDVRKLE